MAMLNLIPKYPGDIPHSMYEAKNWVAYYLIQEQGRAKLSKIPVNPHTGEKAKANDASTWGSYQEAVSMAEKLSARNVEGYGVGFEFGSNSGFAGIDIDNCINEQGELNEIAKEILSEFQTYTERSPSGKGLHLLMTLKTPLKKMRPDLFTDGSKGTGKKHPALEFEIYDSGRFLTVTGNVYRGYALADKTEEVKKLLDTHFIQQAPAKKQETQTYNRPDESDSELWEKMFNAPNGADIQRLYNGDISAYDNDDSRADLALCNHLAYWTNNDAGRMDRMFTQSGLYREKWNREDYRNATIQKAIDGTPDYVPPSQRKVDKQESKIIPQIIFNSEYLDAAFENDMRLFQRYSGRKTGFSNLDGKLTLYPALYVIGAISSLGKSTFCLQMADQLAAAGEHVLFFAFEQTRFELVSKSLARMSQPEDYFIESNPTAIQIRQGRTCQELRETMQKYKELSKHEAIIECDFTTDITTIKNTVEAYIKQFGVKPVVFIDYLQLIRASNPKLTNTKDIIDENIRALKLLQMKNELVVVVVSSINRENYLTTIDFQSFKESGSIEFTADVVLGLQLAIMNEKLFETDTKTTKKRKAVRAAKAETPRRLELCILKNRYGISNESFFFDYYPNFDYFIPADFKTTKDAVLRLMNSIPDDEDKKKPK